MGYEEALEKARNKRDQASYLSETLRNPGLIKIWDEIADWLSTVIYLAEKGLAALREQEQSNEPLTYSQLWDMKGEPVWIVWPDGRVKSQWWIVGSHEWHMMDFYDSQSAREYGSVWMAYRKPPKGE